MRAKLRHPNICTVHEPGTRDGRLYIVMDFVPGESLAEHREQRKEPTPSRQAAMVVRRLALALHEAHRKGIIHRDLKPSNILIDRERKDLVLYTPVDHRHRRGLLRRFPYSVIYRVEPEGILVVAVAHSRRRASYWRGRG